MKRKDFFSSVEPGGLREKQDIKVLICYILSEIGEMTKLDLIAVFQEGGLANYFQVGEAFSELIVRKNIEVKDEKEETYRITESGQLISSQLCESLPLSIRERALDTSKVVVKRRKNEEENKVRIEKTDFGYSVNCSISGGEFNLLKLDIYAPDIDQAEKIKKNFRQDPEGLYRSVLAILTRNKEMNSAFKNMLNSLIE